MELVASTSKKKVTAACQPKFIAMTSCSDTYSALASWPQQTVRRAQLLLQLEIRKHHTPITLCPLPSCRPLRLIVMRSPWNFSVRFRQWPTAFELFNEGWETSNNWNCKGQQIMSTSTKLKQTEAFAKKQQLRIVKDCRYHLRYILGTMKKSRQIQT